jgi:hypothetical protein
MYTTRWWSTRCTRSRALCADGRGPLQRRQSGCAGMTAGVSERAKSPVVQYPRARSNGRVRSAGRGRHHCHCDPVRVTKRMQSLSDWLVRSWLTILTGAAAAVPVIVSTARGVSEGWVPYGDRAVIAARSFDVLTSHPPLVGQYSAWSTILTRPIFSPGPLLYWLLAIPAHFLAPAALPIWIGLVNVAAVVGVVVLARRRGGRPLMFATAIALVLMCRSLTGETFHDIWNPYASLLPFTLLCFLAWSVACGEYRLLPLTALVASFVVETHLTFLVPSVGMLIVALVGLGASRGYVPRWLRRRTARSTPAAARPTASDRRSLRRWAGAAVVLALGCWIPPLINQVFHAPGNLFLIAKAVATHHATAGASVGWNALVHAIGVPPWWLRSPVVGAARLLEVAPSHSPSFGAQVSCVLVLVTLLGVLVVAVRRDRKEVASLAAISLVLSISLGLGTASTPTSGLLALTIAYTLWWASPAGMFVWLTLAWSVAKLSGISLRPTGARWARLASAVALAIAVAGAAVVAAAEAPDPDHGEYRPFAAVTKRLGSALPHPGTVLVTADAGGLGSSYAPGHRHYDHHIAIAYDHPPSAGGRVIATVRVNPPAPVIGTFIVTLLPTPAA